ncbi:hypothetical protein ACW0JT_24805 [Arthrobacter sp. SA17]
MTFFQDLPQPPERPRAPRHVTPVWLAPPANELPGVLHIGKFLHQAPGFVMAVKSAEVFSTGCAIHIVWTVRRTTESDREWATANGRFFRHPAPGPGYVEDPDSALLFGVAFPDGRKTSSTQIGPGMFDGSEPVTGPVLMASGEGGSGSEDELIGSARLWVWPLPEDGDLRLVAQWKEAGMPEQSILLEGHKIAAAARDVQEY